VTEKCGKLGNFLALSDAAKGRARNGLKRQSHLNDGRKNRKSSILSSLDKFLDDDDGTETTSHQSSFSSCLSSESVNSFPRSLPPRIEPTLEEDGQAEPAQTPRRRFARRGSVTKYSLEETQIQKEDDADASERSFSEASVERKKKKKSSSSSSLQHSSHKKTKSKNHVEAVHSKHKEMAPRPRLSKDHSSNLSMNRSRQSIDELPIPMRGEPSMRLLQTDDEGSVTTIDDLPLPMKLGDSTTSFDNSCAGESVEGRPLLPRGRSSTRSTATMPSFDDDDSTFHQQQHSPPKARKSKNSLACLGNLPGAAPKADDHLQDDRSIASQSANEEGGRPRYRRRGSITKFSLGDSTSSFESDDHQSFHEKSLGRSEHLPPRPHRQSSDRQSLGGMLNVLPGALPSQDDHLQDDRSVASGKSEGRQRYRRRGSVTKFSLEDGLNSLESQNDNGHHRHQSHEDDRSVLSEQLPPRSSQSRRVSATKPKRTNSLSAMLSSLPSEASTSVSECDEKSINSDGILGGGCQRYRRRGSVTRYSMSSGMSPSTDEAPASEEEPKPLRRFSRRGSVTKYSLEEGVAAADEICKPPRPPRKMSEHSWPAEWPAQ
jgi:hypothetical protein